MKLSISLFQKENINGVEGGGKERHREREIMANTRLNSLQLCFLIRGRLSGI